MDIYIYEGCKGKYLRLLGVTDCITQFGLERLLCGGDRLEAVFSSGESCERLIKPERIIEIPEVFSGLITGIKKAADGGGVKVNAVSFSGLLSRRVLSEYKKGDSFMTIVDRNCCEAADEKRAFPNTYADKAEDCLFTPSSVQLKRNLSYSVNAVIEKGFRISSEIVHDDGGARIRLYGSYVTDRSINSGVQLPIILSSEYDTLGRQNYSYSETGVVSGAYIYTDAKYGSTGDVNIEAWSGYFGDASGFERCEEAYEIEPVIYYSSMVADGDIIYSAKLDYPETKASAEDLFASRYSPPSEVISASLGKGLVNAIHSGAFGVGDIVTLYPEQDPSRRIMKMTERYDNGGYTMSIYLGKR